MCTRLHDLLHEAFGNDWDQAEALAAYDELARPFHVIGHHAASGYLAAARPHAFTFLDDRLQRALAPLGGVELGTGVIERVMRELNARTDIGGSRWSTAGLGDLVTVKTAQMLHHPIYEQIRKEILLPNTIGFALSEKVNARQRYRKFAAVSVEGIDTQRSVTAARSCVWAPPRGEGGPEDAARMRQRAPAVLRGGWSRATVPQRVIEQETGIERSGE